MGFELGGKRSYLELLMTPGPIVTIIGLVILLISVIFFATARSAEAFTASAHFLMAGSPV